MVGHLDEHGLEFVMGLSPGILEEAPYSASAYFVPETDAHEGMSVAVVWDEDRDARILHVLASLHEKGHLANVIIASESEGSLQLVLAEGCSSEACANLEVMIGVYANVPVDDDEWYLMPICASGQMPTDGTAPFSQDFIDELCLRFSMEQETPNER